jgi:hypothetical protein
MGHIMTVLVIQSSLYPLYFLSGSFCSVPCSQILFNIRTESQGIIKLGQASSQSHTARARYLHGGITYRTPYICSSFRKHCCFAVLKLSFVNSLKLKINLSHSKHSAAALQTLPVEVIAVYSEN